MKKVVCLTLLLTALFLVSMAQKLSSPKKKLNVLFFIADDLRPEIGCYDVNGIKMPNVDKIAARATRFDNAYAHILFVIAHVPHS